MTPIRSAVSMLGASLGLLACTHQSSMAQASPSPLSKRCVSTTTTIDSSCAVRVASAELAKQDSLGPYKPASVRALDEGFVVSLVVAKEPPPLGGGGLVWVDAETGCAVVLRLYE